MRSVFRRYHWKVKEWQRRRMQWKKNHSKSCICIVHWLKYSSSNVGFLILIVAGSYKQTCCAATINFRAPKGAEIRVVFSIPCIDCTRCNRATLHLRSYLSTVWFACNSENGIHYNTFFSCNRFSRFRFIALTSILQGKCLI